MKRNDEADPVLVEVKRGGLVVIRNEFLIKLSENNIIRFLGVGEIIIYQSPLFETSKEQKTLLYQRDGALSAFNPSMEQI